MDYGKISLTIAIFLITNVVIWFQLNSQLVWEWARTNKAIFISCMLGVPISYGFWYCTKIGYEGFGALWPVRFMGFATSMLTFPFLTYYMLGEPLTLKTIITIILSIVIMIVQVL